ncbi:uncharacterized protein LOC117419419 [Acipenser ruthenus]|uniref:uncharacterized protein LOC117419419 n=1 Tax=Acipenser ruthenus TaxID=7906 RepID=UPI00155F9942|nr:uncharacterized protein LOC117419419 [Acipenser ruthenus]
MEAAKEKLLQGSEFCFRSGRLYCESVNIKDLQPTVERLYKSPFYVYSKAQLQKNISDYCTALNQSGLEHKLYYSVKANRNLELLRIISSSGCGATTVSGFEMQIAMQAGFPPSNILYNGSWCQIVPLQDLCGSMTEVIRPSLYSAYHHVDLLDYTADTGHGDKTLLDIVGPVCESADFLAKDRLLTLPLEGSGLVICDVGAYCASAASNYNMRPRPAEILIDQDQWRLIRRPETFEDLLRTCVGI